MYTILKPQFRFAIFLLEEAQNGVFKKREICYADTYEIADGAITFFQRAKSVDDKIMKVPVLSYPTGKWESLALVDDNNYFPAFKRNNQFGLNIEDKPEDTATDDKSGFSTNTANTGSYSSPGLNSHMPGVNNPMEYKRIKNEWIEKSIKAYIKNVDKFDVRHYLSLIRKDSASAQFKVTETDIEWNASTLIKKKLVPARKFSDELMQKHLSFAMPDIIKRQWPCKMATVVEMLQDKGEAKDATPIDIGVWLANNNVVSE